MQAGSTATQRVGEEGKLAVGGSSETEKGLLSRPHPPIQYLLVIYKQLQHGKSITTS